MSATAAIAEKKAETSSRLPRKKVTREEFLRDYSDMEDGYKYEWNNGIVEKTTAMNQEQATLQAIFLRVFIQTKTFKNGGMFTAETDMETSPVQVRRPDLAIYSGEQVKQMKKGKKQVAPWLAEVISTNDKADKINEKLQEYFKAGVQTVWHIFPASKQVYVYTSPEDVTICRGATLCSGAPALPDFQISADDLFA
ncbi:MAG TPA: Uma2 family endonuclease [Bacteroidetes bacterium]|nr:Uma2 family endonuclease [Bacteroidota bacterium]